ncbi:MAG: tetratricopeptide repeat protein [Candidatus Obscuribacterales bacterium]
MPRKGEPEFDKSLHGRLAFLIHAMFAAGITIAPLCSSPVEAADFKYAKKVFVPATRIPRRYDYDTLSGRVARPTYDSISTVPAHTSSGLVPPPPPVSPGLLPAGMAGEVPPPPSALSPDNLLPATRHQRSSIPDRSSSSGHLTATTGHIISRAHTLENEGRLREAQELLGKYSKLHPRDQALKEALSQVSEKRAKYYLRKDDYRQAARQARLALLAEPEKSTATDLLNQSLRHQGVDPANSFSRLKQADLLFSQGKVDEAQVEYSTANHIKPSSQASIGLGNIALRQGNLKGARHEYEMAVETDPQSSVALRQLGIVRYKLKDVVGANSDLTRALVQDPGDKLAGATLIDLWQHQVSTTPKDANAHLGLARAYQLAGNLKAAQNEYRTVVKLDPEHPNLPAARHSFKLALARQEAVAAFEAAQTLDSQGATREAFSKATEAVDLSPGDVGFRLFQAQLLEKLGDNNGAASLYMSVLKKDPKNVIAAQRIKALSEILASANGLSATPGLLTEGPALRSLPSAQAAGLPTAQLPTADPVQNMTGFLGSLRDLMLKQKEALKSHEEDVLTSIGAIKAPSSSSSASSRIAAMPDIDTSDTLSSAGLIKSSDIDKLLGKSSSTSSAASGSSSGSSSGSTGSATGESDSSGGSSDVTLTGLAFSAGQALQADDKLKNLSTLAVQSAPAIINKLKTNAGPVLDQASKVLASASANSSSSSSSSSNSSSSSSPAANPVPTTAPPISTRIAGPVTATDLPPLAPPIAASLAGRGTGVIPIADGPFANDSSRLSMLEEENQKLRKEIETLKKEEVVEEDVEAKIETPEQAAAEEQTSPESTELALRPPIQHPTQFRPAADPASLVRFELIGVDADKKSIMLNVSLRNDQSKALPLPSSTKAVVRLAGSPDRSLKIKFPKKTLEPHTSMIGHIKVPGTRLSPAADVLIPGLVSTDSGNRDIHLTVPISSLPSAAR